MCVSLTVQILEKLFMKEVSGRRDNFLALRWHGEKVVLKLWRPHDAVGCGTVEGWNCSSVLCIL